ncbi:MAG: DUF2092 domain-containing protein [Betaproteobacteria bacterium]|nr:DUF2092 domain-containing protein [Betaproteobacteria bacterium]
MVAAQSPSPPAAPARPATKQAAAGAKPATKASEPALKMVLEPRAMELIKAASDRLAAAKSMSFTAVVSYEYPSKLGPPIAYTTRYDVAMQRPDKLRVLMPGDGPASEFYYDGRTITAYAPVENLAAVVDAPPSLDAMLKMAFQKAAIYFPFSDALVTDPYAAFAGGAILAFYVGPSAVVGGTKTDMVVWANPDVFVQMWIGADDRLPRRMRATFAADPLALRHEMELSDWKLDPVLPPDTFASARARGAGRMAFASPAPPPRGARPITMGKSPQSVPGPSK